jgi:hypothetical protein
MKHQVVIGAFALLLFSLPLLGRDHIDIIVLQNGDRITGEIKGLSAGVLKVDLSYADGALSLDWSKVARVESPQLFIIQTENGSVYTGALATVGDTSKITALTIKVEGGDKTEVAVERSQVVRMMETSESFLQSLSGAIDFGSVYSKGNNATQYDLSSDVEYRKERWGIDGSFTSTLSASTGASTATYNRLGVAAYRLMPWENYFYSTFGGILRSSTQGIDLQTRWGLGAGRFLKNTNRVRFSVILGPVWQRSKYRPEIVPVGTQTVYGAAILTDLNIFLFKKTNLSAKGTVAPALSDLGRVFADMDVSYYWKIFGNFSWNVTFYGNWDTAPPPTFTGSDYGYSSGIKWTFGYR